MEKEKSRMKRLLASALFVSMCSMQGTALAGPAISAATLIQEGFHKDVEGGYASITSNANYTNYTFNKNYLGTTYYDIKAEDFKLSDFDTADNANPNASGGGVFYINQKGITVDIADSAFTNNQALGNPNALDVDGAAISLVNGTVNINNCVFSGNISEQGAINQYSYSKGNKNRESLLNISNSEFTYNTGRDVGALGIFHQAVVENTIFNNNRTLDTEGDGGGAVFLGSEAVAKFDTVQFTDNKSAANGGAISMRDFVKGNNSNAKLDIIDSTFSGNEAQGDGGAIYNTFFSSAANPNYVTISGNTVFNSNKATNGGAIYNEAEGSEISSAIINGATFSGNTATESGSAIFTEGGLDISNTAFNGNEALGSGWAGGAIKVNAAGSEVVIKDSSFANNTAPNGYAGGIYHSYGDVTVENTEFSGNSAAGSAAIMQGTKAGLLTITDSNFENNTAEYAGGALGLFNDAKISNTTFINNSVTGGTEEGGGAIFLGSVSNVTAIDNVVFRGNTSKSTGGAIGMRDPNTGNNKDATLEISGAVFENNQAASNGGAIYNTFENTTIKDSEFTGNIGLNGGAIYNEAAGTKTSTAAGLTVEDVSFTNNFAGELGGAIFANSDVTVNANNSNVVFSGNTDLNGDNDIVMNAAGSTLSLNAASGKSITLNGGVNSGDDSSIYNIAVNSTSSMNAVGQIVLANTVNNADITVTNGTLTLSSVSNVDNSTVSVQSGATLDTVNNQIETIGSNITLASGAQIKADIDTATGAADNFSNAVSDGSDVVISGLNVVGGTTDVTDLSSLNIAEVLGLSNANVTVSDAAMAQTYTVMTPIRKMNGIMDQNGMMTFAPTGGAYKDFNPSVMAAPVAAQLGGYLTQLNAYNQAFHNMDMYMLMTKSQRKAMKLRGRVASTSLVGGVEAAHKDKNMWFNPYTSVEKVGLDDGPKVQNVGYGMFFGGESDLKELGNGWDGVFGAYVGYNGSHQSYDGVSIYQNGGSLGLVGMAYKENFFTGITISTGANAAQASGAFGNEDFSMLMAGIASKSGYNFEFKEGKVILQPSLMMSYTMVNTFDYDNAANVNITSDALHAIHVEPGLKLIGNLKNGWQPYAGVSFVWNILDKAKFQANNVSLPEISVKPYVKYGVGVRKSWGERLAGFFQTYITNGGRNGVGFQAGFSFAIGKDSKSKIDTSGRLPQLKKLELSLKNTNQS